MRKFLFIAAIALLGTLGLSACNNNQSNAPAAQAKLTKPADPNDMKAWSAYLSQIVEENIGDVTNTPYAYFVPDVPVQVAAAAASAGKAGKPGKPGKPSTAAVPASASSAEATLDRVQGQLNDMVAATVLPGNMVAAGGPNSATTAEVLENAFKQAAPGSFKGVVVLFVGDKADEAAVKAAVEPSGATFKFAQM